jgi:hypothetical protein
VYNRINADRSSLVEEQRNNQATKAPFFWHHIRPDRRRQAIMETWHGARRGTDQRRLFDCGQTDGEHAPNWVTLWLLYSVFRSRDIRNNRNRRNEESKPATNGNLCQKVMVGKQLTTVRTGTSGGSNIAVNNRIYDPARNAYVAPQRPR